MHQMQACDHTMYDIETGLVHATFIASLFQRHGHGLNVHAWRCSTPCCFLSSIRHFAEAAPGTPRTALSRSDQMGSRGKGQPAGALGSASEVAVEAKMYSACMDVMQSDHKPVCALLSVVLPSLAPPQARRCGS